MASSSSQANNCPARAGSSGIPNANASANVNVNVNVSANASNNSNPVQAHYHTRRDPRWIFSDPELRSTPSIRAGMSYEEEDRLRRESAAAVTTMANALNSGDLSKVRITQLCISTAVMHMRRFYMLHCYQKFPYKDTAAACLFLAGKSEECFRRMEQVLRVWFSLRFPGVKFDKDRVAHMQERLVYLEALVLETVGFELTVDIPHPYVLTCMQRYGAGKRKLSEMAYWLASDMLSLSDWGVRYTARTIAAVCVQLACFWASFHVEKVDWYKDIDRNLSWERLLTLTEDFSNIYRAHGDSSNIKRFTSKTQAKEGESTAAQNNVCCQRPSISQTVAGGISSLPPPPVAPQLSNSALRGGPYEGTKPPETRNEPTRRIALSDYKQRASAISTNRVQQTRPTEQRHNFMRPDVNPSNSSKGLELPLPPAIAIENQLLTPKEGASQSVKSAPPATAKSLSTQPKGTSHSENKVVVPQIGKSSVPQAAKPPLVGTAAFTNAATQKCMTLKQNSIPKPPQIQKVTHNNEQEMRHRRRLEDLEKDYRRTEKETLGTNEVHDRKRQHEGTDSKKAEWPSSMASHMSHPSSSSSITQRPCEDALLLKRDGSRREESVSRSREESVNKIREGSLSRPREELHVRTREETLPRSRDDSLPSKRPRLSVPSQPLLPPPVPLSPANLMNSSSQNAMRPSHNRVSSYTGDNMHRASSSSWSSSGSEYHGSTVPQARFPPNRHHSASTRPKTRETAYSSQILQLGNTSFNKKSRADRQSPNHGPQKQQEPCQPSQWSSAAAIPPPPKPPTNEELEDGEVL